MTSTSEPSKSELAIHWLGHGILRVILDPRADGVVVPSFLRKQPSLVLEWGFDLPRPIPDMKLDPEAISGTLSFGAAAGLRMLCVVPWSAVYALASPPLDRARLWINDAPPEVQREVLVQAGKRANAKVNASANAKTKARKQARKMKGHLRLVKKETGT